MCTHGGPKDRAVARCCQRAAMGEDGPCGTWVVPKRLPSPRSSHACFSWGAGSRPGRFLLYSLPSSRAGLLPGGLVKTCYCACGFAGGGRLVGLEIVCVCGLRAGVWHEGCGFHVFGPCARLACGLVYCVGVGDRTGVCAYDCRISEGASYWCCLFVWPREVRPAHGLVPFNRVCTA